jgi:hypothetical protein
MRTKIAIGLLCVAAILAWMGMAFAQATRTTANVLLSGDAQT